jgi:hypothetical protein
MWQFQWILSFIPDAVLNWVYWLIIFAGLTGLFAGWLGRFIPLYGKYVGILKPVGIALLVLGVWLRGGYDVEMAWRDKLKQVEAKVAIAEAESKDANTQLVKEKKKFVDPDIETVTLSEVNSVFKDKPFWVFLMACVVSGVLFFQLFTTLPLYHKEQFDLTEFQTGLLITLNGLIIFFLEMPIVSYIERKKINTLKIFNLGLIAMTVSMLLMLINFWAGILIIMMVFMTFGEMFAFPFSNSFAISRAPKGHEGRYMAIFTMSFSLAHIFSSKIGMEIIGHYGYQANWLFMGLLGIVGVILGYWVINLVKKENINL